MSHVTNPPPANSPTMYSTVGWVDETERKKLSKPLKHIFFKCCIFSDMLVDQKSPALLVLVANRGDTKMTKK